jgi:ribosomal protein L24
MASKLRKGDKVVILAGKDKGKEAEITSVNPKSGKAIVQGINMAIRHTKQTQNNQGGWQTLTRNESEGLWLRCDPLWVQHRPTMIFT